MNYKMKTRLMILLSCTLLSCYCILETSNEELPLEDAVPLLLEEVPDDSFKEFNIKEMFEACVPKSKRGRNSEGFDDAIFASWLQDPYTKTEKMEDDDFLDCAALRFQEGMHVKNNKSIRHRKAEQPKAIIHVGPRKTGSTAIQEAMLETYSNNLLDENYLFISKDHHKFTHCLCLEEIPKEFVEVCEESRHILDDMKDSIETARNENKNFLISSESFDQVVRVDPTKIKKLFAGFDIHIVVTYRRYFEWMVSKFGQDYRHSHDWNHWQPHMKPETKNIVSSFSAAALKRTYARYSPLEVFKMYKQSGFSTHMLDFHANTDIVQSFFCLEILNTNNVCELATNHSESAGRANHAESIAYDEIAVAAREAGILNNAKNLTRSQARYAIQHYFEGELGMEESDLPKVYIHQRELDLLEQISIMSESLAVPDYYERKGYQDLDDRFQKYKTTKFYSIDTEQVLLDHGASIESFLGVAGDASSK